MVGTPHVFSDLFYKRLQHKISRLMAIGIVYFLEIIYVDKIKQGFVQTAMKPLEGFTDVFVCHAAIKRARQMIRIRLDAESVEITRGIPFFQTE